MTSRGQKTRQVFNKKYFLTRNLKFARFQQVHKKYNMTDRQRECVECFVFSFHFHYANLSISPIWSSLFTILRQYVPMVTSPNDAGTKGFCK